MKPMPLEEDFETQQMYLAEDWNGYKAGTWLEDIKNVKTFNVQDEYNHDKVWVIKKTKCSHYFMNQMIKGKMMYPKFVKTTKGKLNEIFATFKNKPVF